MTITENLLPDYLIVEGKILNAMLAIMQEGICFLSPEFDVLFENMAMQFWYEKKKAVGKKCYEAYHGRKEPCVDCPVLVSLKSGHPEKGDQYYESDGKRKGWHRIFCVPIRDDNGRTVMMIECIYDISDKTKSVLSMQLLQKQIDVLMATIEEKEEDQRKREQKIIGSMNRSIDVVTHYLSNILDQESFELLRRHLEMARLGVDRSGGPKVRLSGQELMIARYIAQGFVSKEIADKMTVSKKTVDYHRTNIRKKLGLTADENLKDAITEYLVENGL